MKDYTVSLDLVIQALTIFEGLSLWKISEFAAKKNSASLVGRSLKQELQAHWAVMRTQPEIPWKKIGRTILLLLLAWPICRLLNSLVWLLRWTPYIFGVLFPVVMLSFSIDLLPVTISANYIMFAAKCIFWFIIVKLLINLLTPLCNKIPFSQISVEIPSDMVKNIQR